MIIIQSLFWITAVTLYFSPQDASVTQLTQDLAKILGLKIRKAYVRSKVSVSQTPTPLSLKISGNQQVKSATGNPVKSVIISKGVALRVWICAFWIMDFKNVDASLHINWRLS